MLKTLFTIAALMAFLSTANAQQQCKAYYPIGETVPTGCPTGLTQWNNGTPVAPAKRVDEMDVGERTFFQKKATPAEIPRYGIPR